jgi:probable rRNA maturation factor
VTKKEAKAAGKTVADHAAHLVVHGVLHLAGHDHERSKEARTMESLEVKILGRLGIPDPYAAPQ